MARSDLGLCFPTVCTRWLRASLASSLVDADRQPPRAARTGDHHAWPERLGIMLKPDDLEDVAMIDDRDAGALAA